MLLLKDTCSYFFSICCKEGNNFLIILEDTYFHISSDSDIIINTQMHWSGDDVCWGCICAWNVLLLHENVFTLFMISVKLSSVWFVVFKDKVAHCYCCSHTHTHVHTPASVGLCVCWSLFVYSKLLNQVWWNLVEGWSILCHFKSIKMWFGRTFL